MKKQLSILCGIFFLITSQNHAQVTSAVQTTNKVHMGKQSLYDFKVEDLYGKTFDFASLRGKKVMIVNTASKCGLTPQYEQLETIYKQYKDKGFVIVGFPANNFAEQEPGTNEEIGAFCQKNYGVTFPMMGKISVKGEDMADIYKFLTHKELNGVQDSEVEWNFQKYLFDENGLLIQVIPPKTLVTDAKVVAMIKPTSKNGKE
ncbi:MAG TPA: glutathione peroxidase [Flavobacterium sp.]|nr:glutathione peroxidase [Flavobacterium sp.]